MRESIGNAMISKNTTVRIARPTDNLPDIAKMYMDGLGFKRLGQFENHNGFDGIILGCKNHIYHLEFTHHRGTTVGKSPTADNLLVFYLPDESDWRTTCDSMCSAGFVEVESYNPYWDDAGKTFEDLDGYRVVLQNRAWTA